MKFKRLPIMINNRVAWIFKLSEKTEFIIDGKPLQLSELKKCQTLKFRSLDVTSKQMKFTTRVPGVIFNSNNHIKIKSGSWHSWWHVHKSNLCSNPELRSSYIFINPVSSAEQHLGLGSKLEFIDVPLSFTLHIDELIGQVIMLMLGLLGNNPVFAVPLWEKRITFDVLIDQR